MIEAVSHLTSSVNELSERLQEIEKLLHTQQDAPEHVSSVSGKNTPCDDDDIFHQLQAGLEITKGLKHVSEDMKSIRNYDNPAIIKGSGKKHTPKQNMRHGLPSVIQNEEGCIMKDYTNGVITPSFQCKNYITFENCSDCTFVLNDKINAVNLVKCSHVSVLCKATCGATKMAKSVGCTIQFLEYVDTVNVDMSDEIQIYLSTKTLDCTRIYTCASLGVCVLLPRSPEDKAFSENHIPHQFTSILTPRGVVTTPMQEITRTPLINVETNCPSGWWTPRSFNPGERCADFFEKRMKSTGSEAKMFVVPGSYDGPHLSSPPTLGEIRAVAEFFKKGGILPLRYAAGIVLDAWKTLENVDNLVEIETTSKITVCGDLHGNFSALLSVFEKNGWPSPENQYLFNGDFVDRGVQSCEVIFTLLALRAMDPTSLHLARGNHETLDMNMKYGFFAELSRKKYHVSLQSLFTEVFCYLPIAHIVANNTLVVHGGIGLMDMNFGSFNSFKERINKINRLVSTPSEGDLSDLLWSDPQDDNGVTPSPRGAGHLFGPDVTKALFKQTGLGLIIRSHVPQPLGYEIHHGGMVVTVFSSPNYEGNDNMGGFIVLEKPYYNPQFVSFS